MLPTQSASKSGDQFHITGDYAGESKTNFRRETVFPALKVANNAMERTTNSRMKL